MPGLLPPTFSSSKPSMGGGFGLPKATPKTSIFSDQYKQASTSINRANNTQQGAVTSISRVGEHGTQHASTSVARRQQMSARSSVYDTGERDGDRDERRYEYIRRMIREKKQKEQHDAQSTSSSSTGGTHLQKGAGFSKFKFHKKFRSFLAGNRSRFKNISTKDQEIFENIISERASHKAVGQDFTGRDKRIMRSSAKRAKLSGKISGEDVKDFGKIIETLD